MFPFFLLRIRKGKDYSLFNPVDNREYTVNYAGFRVLEQCDGAHSLDEIVAVIAGDFGKTEKKAASYVAGFLADMTARGMVAWREDAVHDVPDWGPPETIFWDITSRCNLRCTHCYNSDNNSKKPELTSDEVKRVMDELSAFGVGSIVFSGGEPLLRKDFVELMRHAASCGFNSLSIATNGTLINRQMAKEMRKTGVSVQVSIDGHTAALHDEIRGVNGAFEKAVRGIKLLQEEDVPVSTCTVATKKNIKRIPAIISLMQGLKVDNYRFQGMMPIGRGKNNATMRLRPTGMKRLVEYLTARSIDVSSYNFTLKDPPADPVDFESTGACAAATSSGSINSEGYVVPCTHFWGLRADNVRDHTFKWIWQNSAMLRYFRSITLDEVKGHCRECAWLMACHAGCKVENFLTGDIFDSNRSCWVADAALKAANPK